jgi:hypothetical protein
LLAPKLFDFGNECVKSVVDAVFGCSHRFLNEGNDGTNALEQKSRKEASVSCGQITSDFASSKLNPKSWKLEIAMAFAALEIFNL